MLLARLGMLEGIEVNEYLKPGISDAQAQAIYDRLMELQTSIDSNESGYTVSDAYLTLVGLSANDSLLENNDMSIGIKEPTHDRAQSEQVMPVQTAQTIEPEDTLEDIPEPEDNLTEPAVESEPVVEPVNESFGNVRLNEGVETDFSECITPPLDADTAVMPNHSPQKIEM